MIIIALPGEDFHQLIRRKRLPKSSLNLRLLQIETRTWKILAGDVNSGKSVDAILMSSKDHSANNRHEDCHTFCNCFCDQ